MANIRDLAIGVVATAPSPATSGGSLILQSGQGADMPTTTPFKVLAFPPGAAPTKSNAEKLLVTARSTDTLTITRAQGETTAKSIAVGWYIVNAIFTEDVNNTNFVFGEIPTGTVNGVNTSFSTASAFTTGTLRVYKNGIRLLGGGEDYTATTSGFTMVTAPATGTRLTVDYQVVTPASSTVGASTLVSSEVPGGSVNSSNTAFTTASTYTAGSLKVFLNGQRLKSGSGNDFVEAGAGFTMQYAPLTGDILLVDYQIDSSTYIVGTNSFVTQETPAGSVNGSNAVFTTSKAYIGSSLKVYINGLVQAPTTHVTETTPASGIFTLDVAPSAGDIVRVDYQFNLSSSGNADTVDGAHASTTSSAGIIPVADSNGVLATGFLGRAWQSWTPTLTNLSGGTLTYAKYTQSGKTVHARFRYVLGGAGVAGSISVSLPVTAASDYVNVDMVGSGQFTDASLATYMAYVTLSSTTALTLYASTANSTYVTALATTSTAPFTWGNGDWIQFSITYEVA